LTIELFKRNASNESHGLISTLNVNCYLLALLRLSYVYISVLCFVHRLPTSAANDKFTSVK